jgi:hypothetical protein
MNFRKYMIASLISIIGIPVSAQLVSDNGNTSNDIVVMKKDEQRATEKFTQAGNNIEFMSSKHLDGVKGAALEIDIGPPPYTTALPDKRLDALRLFACTSAAFGQAELVGKKSFLGKDGDGVFTKMRFRIIDDWRDQPENSKVITVVSQGGEVNWKGQKYRVTSKFTDFKIGSKYILVAGSRFEPASDSIFENLRFFEVVNDSIYSGPGWSPFSQGSTILSAKGDVTKALTQRGCK